MKPNLTEEEKALLKLREERKRKMPDFVRQESWRYVRIKENWRRPRGKDSKMRLHKKGYPKCPRVGYRSPKLVRGLHPSGFREVLVYNVKDVIAKVKDPTRYAVRIASCVGERKRKEIVEYAAKHGIKVLN